MEPSSTNSHDFFNVNSIVTREKRLTLDLHIKKFIPDIVLLSETMLKPVHKVSFQNYSIIRNDRLTGSRSGTAILVRDIYEFKIIKIIPTTTLEYTAISIKCGNKTPLSIFHLHMCR